MADLVNYDRFFLLKVVFCVYKMLRCSQVMRKIWLKNFDKSKRYFTFLSFELYVSNAQLSNPGFSIFYSNATGVTENMIKRLLFNHIQILCKRKRFLWEKNNFFIEKGISKSSVHCFCNYDYMRCFWLWK